MSSSYSFDKGDFYLLIAHIRCIPEKNTILSGNIRELQTPLNLPSLQMKLKIVLISGSCEMSRVFVNSYSNATDYQTCTHQTILYHAL